MEYKFSPSDWQTETLLHWPRSPCNGNCSSVPWYWPQGNQQPLPNEVSIFLPLQTIFCCSCLEWNQAVITPKSSTALSNTQGWQPSFTRKKPCFSACCSVWAYASASGDNLLCSLGLSLPPSKLPWVKAELYITITVRSRCRAGTQYPEHYRRLRMPTEPS